MKRVLSLHVFTWVGAVAVILAGRQLSPMLRDFGVGIAPLWPVITVGCGAQIILTVVTLFRSAGHKPDTLTGILLGYWLCLMVFLFVAFLYVTVNLQQLRTP